MRANLIFALLLCSINAHSSTWFVSTTGSDAHGCTNSGADVCLTLDRGIAVAAASDIVQAAGGTYGAQTITQTKTSPGVTVTCATVNGCILGALNTSGAWYTLTDFEVNVGSAHGTGWGWGGDHILGLNIRVKGGFASVFPAGTNNIWDGGQLGAPGAAGQRSCTAGDTEPVQITTGGSFVIRNVTFYQQLADGTDAACGSPPGFHLEMMRLDVTTLWTSIIIEKNKFPDPQTNTTETIFFGRNGGSNSTLPTTIIRNNFFANDINNNIGVNTVITNCSSLTVAYNTLLGGYNGIDGCGSGHFQVIGNAGWKQSFDTTDCGANHVKNVWQDSNSFSCGTDTAIIGTRFATDQLGLGGALGYTVQSGSPLINAGESTCATTANAEDIDGHIRPIQTACDAGAFEFGTVVVTIYPMPSKASHVIIRN